MPKVGPRNEVGLIFHAVVNRVLSNHTARNIYGNVNYAKTFIQGTFMNVFNGCMPGGKNAIWKLMVDFKMPSDEAALGVELKRIVVYFQNCILGRVPAGKNPQCSINFTDLIARPDHTVKGSTIYLPNAKGRAPSNSRIATASAASRVLLLPAGNKIEVSSCPLPSPHGRRASHCCKDKEEEEGRCSGCSCSHI
jgi:hypothetical protein